MKSFVISAASLASLISLVQAAVGKGGSFGLVLIRSGSPLQYASPSVGADNKLVISAASSSDHYTGYFLPDGRVRQGGTDMWLSVDTDHSLAVLNAKPMNWGVTDDGHLSAGSNTGFVAVQNADGSYGLFTSGKNATGTFYDVIIRVEWIESSSSASDATSTSAAPQTSSAHPNITATTTNPGQTTETVTKCHEDGTCSQTTVPQVNAAAGVKGFVGAAAVAFAGALFL